MAIKIDFSVFKELLAIQKERQVVLDELSVLLGYDISFSNDEVVQFAEEEYSRRIDKELSKEVEEWTKLAFS
jgi:ATP:corrinoid adenosyltransferase